MNERRRMDPVMLFAALLLVGIGVVMVYSASAVFAQKQTGDGFYYFKRQLVNVVFGLAALIFGFRLGIERFCKFAYPLLLVSVVLLLLVIMPGIGSRVGGSARWISLGFMNFQPAELAKISFVLYLAFSLTRKREQIQAFTIGFLPHLIVTSVFVFLLLSQPDFGTATIVTVILFLMLYVAGTRFSYIALSALAALPMAYGLIVGSEYRMRRLLAFLDPWADRYNVGYHITESLMSFGSGGLFGVGLGEGKHKLFFLPAIHTDFIFSLIGEELGMLGALFVIALFSILIWRGMAGSLAGSGSVWHLFGLWPDCIDRFADRDQFGCGDRSAANQRVDIAPGELWWQFDDLYVVWNRYSIAHFSHGTKAAGYDRFQDYLALVGVQLKTQVLS